MVANHVLKPFPRRCDNFGVAVNLRWLPIQTYSQSNVLHERFNHGEGVEIEILIHMALAYPF